MPDTMLEFITGLVVASIATGRIVRLVVDDDWPPIVWARNWYVRRVPDNWAELVVCPFCVAPYVAAINMSWAFLSGMDTLWWFANTLAAVAYLAAIVNVRDVPVD